MYGDANPALTYTVAADGVGTSRGLANGDTLSGAVATTAGATSNVGSYAITQGTLTNANNTNYAITYTNGNSGGWGAAGECDSGDDKSRVYGDANPALTYTVAADGVGTSRGLANGDTLSGAVATTAGATSNVGSYAITQGTLAATSNYALTYNNGSLSVTTALPALPTTTTVVADVSEYTSAVSVATATATSALSGSSAAASSAAAGSSTLTASSSSVVTIATPASTSSGGSQSSGGQGGQQASASPSGMPGAGAASAAAAVASAQLVKQHAGAAYAKAECGRQGGETA